MQSAQLFVDTTLVKAWENPEPDFGPLSVAVNAMFDSTHFAEGTQVRVKFVAWDNYGRRYPLTGYAFCEAPVDNTSVVYGRYDMEVDPIAWDWDLKKYTFPGDTYMTALPAETRISAMGYRTYRLERSIGWSAAQHLADIGVPNVIYVASHGGASDNSRYWTDINDYTWQYAWKPAGPPDWSFERIIGTPTGRPNEFPVLPVRQAANGTGLPPFNTGRPPVNLAFIMACHTGETNDLSAFLYPFGNAYVGTSEFSEDQAYCGYVGGPAGSQLRSQVEVFFDALTVGYTCHLARNLAMDAYYVQPPDIWLNVYGDFAMKLKGVYDGNPDAPASLAWYR